MRVLALVLLITTVYAKADDNFGLGVTIGSPIGLHYFYELDNKARIEGTFGNSLTQAGTIIDSHYVKTKKNELKLQAYDLDFNYGVGARIVSKKTTLFGPSTLIGVDHEIENTNFSVLANSGAAFLFGDGLKFDLNLYLGANYRF